MQSKPTWLSKLVTFTVQSREALWEWAFPSLRPLIQLWLWAVTKGHRQKGLYLRRVHR